MNSLNIVNLMHKKAIYRHHIDNNNNHKINLYHQTNIKIDICNTTNQVPTLPQTTTSKRPISTVVTTSPSYTAATTSTPRYTKPVSSDGLFKMLAFTTICPKLPKISPKWVQNLPDTKYTMEQTVSEKNRKREKENNLVNRCNEEKEESRNK